MIGGQTERMGEPFRMTWAFVVEPIGGDATHLVTRIDQRGIRVLPDLLDRIEFRSVLREGPTPDARMGVQTGPAAPLFLHRLVV